MPVFFAIISLLFGLATFVFANPAGVPVFGLAFAAAGWLRESRGAKRTWMYFLLSLATGLCAYGTIRSLGLNFR